MYPASWLVVIMVSLFLLIWAGFLLWAWRSNQLQDPERAKYRVLEDDLSGDQ